MVQVDSVPSTLLAELSSELAGGMVASCFQSLLTSITQNTHYRCDAVDQTTHRYIATTTLITKCGNNEKLRHVSNRQRGNERGVQTMHW